MRDDLILISYRTHLKITGKQTLAGAPAAVHAFHKCSVGGGAYFDTKKRLWRGKGRKEGLRPTEFKSTLMAVHFVGRFQTPF